MKFNVEPDITDREDRKKIGIVRMKEWKNLTESKCSELREGLRVDIPQP